MVGDAAVGHSFAQRAAERGRTGELPFRALGCCE